jgi:internalin A
VAASEGERVALERIAREVEERTGFLDLGKLALTELPAELFQLKLLRSLNLGGRWLDASGQQQNATGELGENQVAMSIGRLRDLPTLRALSLNGISLDTLSSLAGLENLRDCSMTHVSDLAPLCRPQGAPVDQLLLHPGRRPRAPGRPQGAHGDQLR